MDIAAFLPRTQGWALRLTVAAVSAFFVLGGVHILVFVVDHLSVSVDLILASFLLATGIGLWRLKSWARKLTLFFFGFLAIAIPAAMGSPGFYQDFLQRRSEIPWLRMALVVTAVEVPAFWVLYILGKYKRAFG